MKKSGDNEKTNAKHEHRKVYRFILEEEPFELVLTKHGHYRILESKNLSFKSYGQMLLSMGKEEILHQMINAKKLFPLNERKNVEWQRKVDYSIAVYDVIHKMVVILGVHPHLRRITVVTIIPRIENVLADVFAAYRLDNKETENTPITYRLKKDIKMKLIKI